MKQTQVWILAALTSAACDDGGTDSSSEADEMVILDASTPMRVGRRDVEREVKEILVDQLGVTYDELTPTQTLGNDLGVDSLALVELVLVLERTFGYEIPEDANVCDMSVSELVSYIQRLLPPGE